MAEEEWASPLSKKGMKEAIQDVLGGGGDIDAANPLQVSLGANPNISILHDGSAVSSTNPLSVRSAGLGTLIVSHHNVNVVGGTNILGEAIQTSQTVPVTWRVYAVFQQAGIFAMRRIVGGNTYTERFNAGANLGVRAIHSQDVIIQPGDRIQFVYNIATIMDTLIVVELYGG